MLCFTGLVDFKGYDRQGFPMRHMASTHCGMNVSHLQERQTPAALTAKRPAVCIPFQFGCDL